MAIYDEKIITGESLYKILKNIIQNIELTPGPKGDKGDKGDPGTCKNENPYKIIIMGDSISAVDSYWISNFVNDINVDIIANVAFAGAHFKDYSDTPTYTGELPTQDSDHLNVMGNQAQRILNQNYITPDAILMFCGTNDQLEETDSNINAEFFIGAETKPIDTVNRRTLPGAIRWCYEKLMTKYTNTNFFIITPIQAAEKVRSSIDIIKKRDIIIDVANRLCINHIDATFESGISSIYEKNDKTDGRYLVDGLHPNRAGAKVLAKAISRRFIEIMKYEVIKEHVNVTLTNIIEDPLYLQPQVKWYYNGSQFTHSVLDGELTLTARDNIIISSQVIYSIAIPFPTDHIFYARIEMQTTNVASLQARYINMGPGTSLGWTTSKSTDWVILSDTIQTTLTGFIPTIKYPNNTDISGKSFKYKRPIVVDLTESFGAGNEPSKEWCDVNIPFFENNIII